MTAESYPPWICSPCGGRFGKRIPELATFHAGDRCGWCGEEVDTTEPRDFGYPDPPEAVAKRPPSGAPVE